MVTHAEASGLDIVSEPLRFRVKAGVTNPSRGQLRVPTRRPGEGSIQGMRVTVGMIVSQIGAGRTIENVLNDFPYLVREDVLKVLQYAAWLSQEREIVLAAG